LTAHQTESSELITTRKALQILGGLRSTDAGNAIYQHLEHTFESLESTHLELQKAYAGLLTTLLDAYQRQLPTDSPQRVHLQILRIRLTPPLTIADFATLHEEIERLSKEIESQETVGQYHLDRILAPVLEAFGVPSTRPGPEPPAAAQNIGAVEPGAEAETGDIPRLTQELDVTYRRHLEGGRERIRQIQSALARQIADTIKQNEEFGVLLEVELEALRHAADLKEVEHLRHTLTGEVEKLLVAHRSLTARLDSTQNYLRIIESDSQQLSDELSRVHLLSVTDELTNLPNRRAFIRRLEDEVARVQRYGSPLSLALIDLDGFKSVNDRYGHAAGDEVLRHFATHVLSSFRHHDLVARYGGEEFSVILPNTNQEGALHALQKVKERAAHVTVQFGGETLPQVTFSAGLAIYKSGQTPSELIERADSALYKAKNLGRNRIEVDNSDDEE